MKMIFSPHAASADTAWRLQTQPGTARQKGTERTTIRRGIRTIHRYYSGLKRLAEPIGFPDWIPVLWALRRVWDGEGRTPRLVSVSRDLCDAVSETQTRLSSTHVPQSMVRAVRGQGGAGVGAVPGRVTGAVPGTGH